MPRSSRVLRMWTTCGRSVTEESSSRMPSQTVLSRSQTTHLIDCFSFFLAAWTASAWVSATPATSESVDISELLQLEERDGDLLDLRAPFDDLEDAGVAQVALDGIVLAAAVGAVDLHGVGGGAGGHGRGVVLCDHDLAGGAGVPLVAQPAGAQAEEPGGAHLGDHIGEHAADELVVGDRHAELHAPGGVGAAGVEAGLADADAPPGDAVAAMFQGGEDDVRDTEAGAAEQVLLRHPGAVEEDPGEHG